LRSTHKVTCNSKQVQNVAFPLRGRSRTKKVAITHNRHHHHVRIHQKRTISPFHHFITTRSRSGLSRPTVHSFASSMPSIANSEIMSATARRLSQRAQGILARIGCSSEVVLCRFEPEVWMDLTLWPTDYCFPSYDQPDIPRVVSITEDDDCSDSISDICEIRHCSVKPSTSADNSTGSSTGTERLETRTAGSEDSPAREVSKQKRQNKTYKTHADVPLAFQRRSIPPSEYPIVFEDAKRNRYGYV
jgi:hypothetical protein